MLFVRLRLQSPKKKQQQVWRVHCRALLVERCMNIKRSWAYHSALLATRDESSSRLCTQIHAPQNTCRDAKKAFLMNPVYVYSSQSHTKDAEKKALQENFFLYLGSLIHYRFCHLILRIGCGSSLYERPHFLLRFRHSPTGHDRTDSTTILLRHVCFDYSFRGCFANWVQSLPALIYSLRQQRTTWRPIYFGADPLYLNLLKADFYANLCSENFSTDFGAAGEEDRTVIEKNQQILFWFSKFEIECENLE